MAVAGQVLILDAVDGGAAALDDAQLVVRLVLRPENENFQGLFVALEPHEHQSLGLTVVIEVHHLNGLDILPGAGGDELIALLLQVVQLLGQARVFRRHPGQGEQVLHRRAENAPRQRQRHRCRQGQGRGAAQQVFHGTAPSLRSDFLTHISYHSFRRLGTPVLSGVTENLQSRSQESPGGRLFLANLVDCPFVL